MKKEHVAIAKILFCLLIMAVLIATMGLKSENETEDTYTSDTSYSDSSLETEEPSSEESFTDDYTGESETTDEENVEQEEIIEPTEKPKKVNVDTPPSFSSEKNSSAMVDEIAIEAKKIADNMTDKQAKKITSKIKKAKHKYYNNNKKMEMYMWYGFLLDYKYDDSDPRSELGTDLVQAIKYVYRKAEKVSDSATQENLDQIDEDLANIE